MKLHEIQAGIKETLINPADEQKDSAPFQDIFDTRGVSIENRMKVYRNNVIQSLCSALASAYPAMNNLTGNDFFEDATRAYASAHIPAQGNLNLYGDTFPEFLEEYKPAKSLPYLPDLARLEWACEKAYYAKDDTALTPEALQDIAQDELPYITLSLRASASLIKAAYPLDEIYNFCLSDKVSDKSKTLDISKRKKTAFLIFRPEYSSEIYRIAFAEYVFLNALQKGQNILQATEDAAAANEHFDLAASLQHYLRLGLFSDFFQKA